MNQPLGCCSRLDICPPCGAELETVLLYRNRLPQGHLLEMLIYIRYRATNRMLRTNRKNGYEIILYFSIQFAADPNIR
jgi:hypothetical protein